MDEIMRELRRLDRNVADRLVEIYDRIAKVGLLLLLILAINVVSNCLGVRFTSIIVALAGTAIILYRAYDPWILLNPLGAAFLIDELEKLTDRLHLTEKKKEEAGLLEQALDIYNETVLETILWFNFLSLIIGIFPMWGRLKMGLIVILALASFKIAATILKKPPIFAKVAYRVSLIIFFVAICWTFLSPVSLWLTGYDAKMLFQLRPDWETMSNADKTRNVAERSRRIKKINALEIISKERELTEEEKEEWEKLRRGMSILGKISSSKPKTPILVPVAVAEVGRYEDPRFARCLTFGGRDIHLSPGDYHMEPSDKEDGVRFFLIGEGTKGLQNLGDGINFTVPQGTKLVGVLSDRPRKIYPGKK